MDITTFIIYSYVLPLIACILFTILIFKVDKHKEIREEEYSTAFAISFIPGINIIFILVITISVFYNLIKYFGGKLFKRK